MFFSFFRPHLGLFALDMSCAVAVAVIDLAFPYITRVSMQTLLPEKLYTTFFVIMAAMFAAYILKGVLYYLITVLGHKMGVYIEADMRHAVFNHMQKLSFSFFDHNRTGVLMSRITSDLFEITELAHHGPEDILISVLTIIGSLIVLAGIEWRLALVLAVCLPLLIMFTLSRRVSMKKANIEVKRQTAEINAAIESGISGIRTAKAFANEEAEDEKFVAANERYKAARNRYFKAMGTNGEIEADMLSNKIHVRVFGEPEEIIDVKLLANDLKGHGGGDSGIVNDFLDMLINETEATERTTTLEHSLESHFMALAAEESRLRGGELINMDAFKNGK